MKTGILLAVPLLVYSASIKDVFFHHGNNVSNRHSDEYGSSGKVSMVVDLTDDDSNLEITKVGFNYEKFEKPRNDDKTVYVVNKLDDISDHPGLINYNNRFLARDSHESIYWDEELGSWVKQTYNMNLDIGEKQVELEACLDASNGDDGSLSRSTSYSVSLSDTTGISYSLTFATLDISFLLNWLNPELELAVSVSFKTSASCNIKKGEYGRLLSVFTTATTKPFGKTLMKLENTKFVPTSETTLVLDVLEYFVDKMPQTICHRSNIPC